MNLKAVLLSILLWAGVAGGIIYVASQNHNRPRFRFYAIGILAAGAAAQAGIGAYFDRQRLRTLAAALAARGYVTNFDEGTKAEALHYQPDKKHHSFKAVMSALGVTDDRPAHVAEYKYTIGHGKGAQTFRMMEVGVDFPFPGPPLVLAKRAGFLSRPIGKLLPGGDPLVHNEQFNKRWESKSADAAHTALLTPELTTWLAESPAQELQWCLADGWLTCTWRKTCNIVEVDMLLGRALTFAEHAEAAAGARESA